MLDFVHLGHTVDEFIFHMTHDRVTEFLLPGVPPTGKKLSIPMIAIVSVRGDRLYNGEWLLFLLMHILKSYLGI